MLLGERRSLELLFASDAYTQYFDWSDAVISIRCDTANIIDILTELDAQPDSR